MVERSPEALDLTFGALSHPARRAMLDLLRPRSLRVTDLAEPFDISLAAASKHIRVLESAGLIARAISGRDHVLALSPQPLADARGWIDTYRSYWEGRLEALDAHLRDGTGGGHE